MQRCLVEDISVQDGAVNTAVKDTGYQNYVQI